MVEITTHIENTVVFSSYPSRVTTNKFCIFSYHIFPPPPLSFSPNLFELLFPFLLYGDKNTFPSGLYNGCLINYIIPTVIKP